MRGSIYLSIYIYVYRYTAHWYILVPPAEVLWFEPGVRQTKLKFLCDACVDLSIYLSIYLYVYIYSTQWYILVPPAEVLRFEPGVRQTKLNFLYDACVDLCGGRRCGDGGEGGADAEKESL